MDLEARSKKWRGPIHFHLQNWAQTVAWKNTYYETLGVSSDANLKAIEKAYNECISNPNVEKSKLEKVVEAYKFLTNTDNYVSPDSKNTGQETSSLNQAIGSKTSHNNTTQSPRHITSAGNPFDLDEESQPMNNSNGQRNKRRRTRIKMPTCPKCSDCGLCRCCQQCYSSCTRGISNCCTDCTQGISNCCTDCTQGICDCFQKCCGMLAKPLLIILAVAICCGLLYLVILLVSSGLSFFGEHWLAISLLSIVGTCFGCCACFFFGCFGFLKSLWLKFVKLTV